MKRSYWKKALAIVIIAMLTISASLPSLAAPVPSSTAIYRDYENYSFAERAADMVARMTKAQKGSNLISSTSAVPAGNDAQGTLSTGVKVYNWWSEALHGYNTGPGASDNTSYPLPMSMAQSWDPSLIYRVYSEESNEIREHSPDFYRYLNFYSPVVMEPLRDPRWGRQTEGLSEDPVLAAALGAQVFNGFQGFEMDGKTLIDPNGYWKANTTAKHYLANNSEINRLSGVANMTEQEHREYYGYSYRQLIKQSEPASVMSSYNRIQVKDPAYSKISEMPGGINNYTLDTLLRQTYGFKGYVTSDCDSVGVAGSGTQTRDTAEGQGADGYTSAQNHGWQAPSFTWYGEKKVTANAMTSSITSAQLAAWGIMGGGDLECSGGVAGSKYYAQQLPVDDDKAEEGIVTPFGYYTESAADVALAELMEARLRVGEWDSTENYTANAAQTKSTGRVSWYDKARNAVEKMGLALPTGNNAISAGSAQTMTDERLALAEEAATESIVLLKNDINKDVNNGQALLPLQFPETGDIKVAVVGSLRTNNSLGQYSGRHSGAATAKQVNPLNGITAALKAKYGDRVTITDKGEADCDYIIAVVGDNGSSGIASEQQDRKNFNLKDEDIKTIKDMYAINKKLIVVMITSCGIGEVTTATKTDNMYDSVPALLYSAFLGERPGVGIANVLLGNENPSARTVFTWYPKSSGRGEPQARGKEAGTDLRANYGSLNQIRSYRLSPGKDGPWSSPLGDGFTPEYTFNQDGPNLGRTYMYYSGTGDQSVRFPFGFGLSYTNFTYSEPSVKVNGVVKTGDINVQPNDEVEYSVKITNTGSVAGAEVAQLYVKTPTDVYNKSSKESYGEAYAIKRLKDFQKTAVLEPGDSETVTLSVKIPDIAFWSNANDKFELMQLNDPYILQVSRSSADTWNYQGQNYGVQFSSNMKIADAANWNPKVSVVSFKAHTTEDAKNNIPERLIYKTGDTILPSPTVSMANDVLYGYINRMYSSAEGNMYPIPENITLSYVSNRPGVVQVNEDGTLTALGGGVATITGTATDSITGSSVSDEFVVYVGGLPADIDYDTTMKQFTYNGETFKVEEGATEFDVNVANNVSKVDFTAANIAPNYPDDVDVKVTLNPEDGSVSANKPCVATVEISSKELAWSDTYKINFGKMSIAWEPDENYMGYHIRATVRFSDGVTPIRLIQSWTMLDTGDIDTLVTETFKAPAKNTTETLQLTYYPKVGDTVPTEWLVKRQLNKFAWNANTGVPLLEADRVDWLPPKIDNILINGVGIEGFDPNVTEYEYVVPFGDSAPRITASYNSNKMSATVSSVSVPGTVNIAVDNITKTASSIYTITLKAGANPNRIVAKKGTPATLDANDPAWANANEIVVAKRSTDGGNNANQASGKAKVLYDDGFFYARVEMYKDSPLNANNSNDYQKDSIELYLSETNYRGSYSGVTNGNQYRITFQGRTSQKSNNSGWTGTGVALTDIPAGQYPYGYVVVYKIPWTNANIPQAGKVMGFDVQANVMNTSNQRTCFTWSDGSANGYNSSTNWGEVILG